MTAQQYPLVIRTISGPEELDLFCTLPYSLNHELAADLAAGRRRPEWLWMALQGDRLVARAAWWSRPGRDAPQIFDIFDVFDAEDGQLDLGEQLLRAALAEVAPVGRPPEFTRFLPADWRSDPAVRRGVEGRMAVLERVGARPFVERLRLEWRPGTPVPEPSGRLAFRPVEGRDELVSLMVQVLDGTLDAYSRDDLSRMTAQRAAAQQYEQELMSYRSPHDWWRIATLPDGEPVGFVIPAHNGYNPIIAYLGVLPKHRGNGHINEILAEGTRILASQDVPRIRAATDVGNTPMAAAFQRAGYVVFEQQLDMVWP